jgi:photosystem II stability/assembly factor-like uncharacterized protein
MRGFPQHASIRQAGPLPIRTVLLSAAIACLALIGAEAHVPHDDVQDVAPSPAFSRDGTVFSVVRGSLFRSVDGGYTWRRTHRGLCTHKLHRVVLSPDFGNDRTLIVVCDRGDMFRSRDAGGRWARLDAWPGAVSEDLAISPRFGTDGAVLALTVDGTLLVTRDAGAHWNEISAEIPRITAMDWTGNRIVVATTAGQVHVSVDDASTWTMVGTHPAGAAITVVESVDEGGTETGLFVGTEHDGVFRVDGSGAFHGTAAGPTGKVTGLESRTEGGRTVLWATTWHDAVFRSEDAGETWTLFDEGLSRSRQADAYGHPHFTAVDLLGDSSLVISSFCGLHRSDDGGRSWHKLETSLGHVIGLAATPNDKGGHTLAVSTYAVGVYLTDDGGESWAIANRGLWNPRTGPIALSPDFANDGTLWAGSYFQMMRTLDSGRSWDHVSVVKEVSRFEYLRRSTVRRLSRSETFSKLIPLIPVREEAEVTVPLVVVPSPAFSSDRMVFVGLTPDGVRRSTDGGTTYRLIWETQGSPVRSLVISPEFENDRTLFAALRDGIYRTRDAGEHWETLGGGAELGSSVLALSPAFGTDGTLFAGSRSGLHRSRDAGETWVKLPIVGEDEGLPIEGVAISPDFAEDRTLLVQTRGGNLLLCRDGEDEFEAVPTSAADSGYEFTHVVRRDSISLIQFSPDFAEDRTVYGASAHELLRSTDGGMTWTEIPRPVRYEVEAAFDFWLYMPVDLEGDWQRIMGPEHSARSEITAVEAGSAATIRFHGTGATWLGTLGPDGGTASVLVDGEPRATVDLHGGKRVPMAELFSVRDLPRGPHTLTIVVDGAANRRSSGTRVSVDAIDVRP